MIPVLENWPHPVVGELASQLWGKLAQPLIMDLEDLALPVT